MKYFLIVIAILFASVTMAEPKGCIYQGKLYPVGTKLGDLTCQPDGTWK